ncbi:putative membrane protein DUF2142 [Streptomyces sp. 1114.5]|uniref:DUF2142 domain-containing protein n=1 Tax=unclassified Streptomyces TaxID=2593676 RepID=UPI000BCD2DDE|nr:MULTISPECIES: DUF2142 domain-containing protein [unclassified Streptomyces]RKT17376.1 putative membrane protein DUF2142 [Streptomyces sp. 1114.5]SOB83584.1 Predicted membrane protein [Streptomyces sp. 1331.2]
MMITAVKSLADRLASSPRRLWAVAFAILFVLSASWSLSTPTGASPDEHAHLIRAAAVARGQVEGREVMVPHVVGGIDGKFAETGVVLPRIYQDLKDVNACYVFVSERSASCAPTLKDRPGTALVTTAAGRYHPAYYFAVGWPSLLVHGEAAFYLMRLMSALICSALVASAVVSAAEWRRRSFTLLGVITAATPMALFMFGVVNPSGPEIAAGILVWSAGLPMLMSPDPYLLNRRLARLGIGALVLISIRPLGLIWFAGALFFGLLLSQKGAVREVLRRKVAWVWGGLAVAAAGSALVWSSSHPDNSVINTPSDLTPLNAARKTFDNGLLYMKHMIGYFGWLDAQPPAATLLVWCAVVLALAMLALCYARFRDTLAIVGVMVGIVVIPIAAQAMQARQLGMIWQGRYLLPFAVGLPIMCAALCHERLPWGGFAWRRLLVISSFSLGLVNAAAFLWALRRNADGTEGPLLISPAHWSPPGSWPLWLLVYTLTALAFGLFAAVSDNRERTGPQPSGAAGAEDAGGRTRLAGAHAEA